MIYQAVNADLDWGNNRPVFLQLSDIYKQYSWDNKVWTDKYGGVLTTEEIKEIAQKALNVKHQDLDYTVFGLAMVAVRGDSGHFIFAPILAEHIGHVRTPRLLKSYWDKQFSEGKINKDEYYNYQGYRKDANGKWTKSDAAFSNRWLAGEIARYEMMYRLMPADMIRKGSEFFRRMKIATTPVFTSPLMRDFTAVKMADTETEMDEIYFVDRNGNEGKMLDVIPGMGKKNRTDGASIISSTLTNDIHDAFGADTLRRLFKTVIWKADLSLAVKHQMFEPESRM